MYIIVNINIQRWIYKENSNHLFSLHPLLPALWDAQCSQTSTPFLHTHFPTKSMNAHI